LTESGEVGGLWGSIGKINRARTESGLRKRMSFRSFRSGNQTSKARLSRAARMKEVRDFIQGAGEGEIGQKNGTRRDEGTLLQIQDRDGGVSTLVA